MSAATSASGIELDIRRALREGQPHEHPQPLSVTSADLRECEGHLGDAQNRLEGTAPPTSGFLDLDWEAWACPKAEQVAADLARDTDVLVVLGMGGSALGARAIAEALSPTTSRRLEILDTVDPTAVRSLCNRLDPQRTAVVAISKSGRTVETRALFRVVLAWLQDGVGSNWPQRVAVVTEPGDGPLARFAVEHGLPTLPVPANVGGRFSVLTAVGQLPAAYLGVDCDGLRRGAEAMKACVQRRDLRSNPAWQLAAVQHCWADKASLSTLLIYCERLAAFGRWFRQLLGESLGKRGPSGIRHGIVPAVGRGPADQHSQLQLWTDGPRNSLFTILRVTETGPPPAPESGAGPAAELFPWMTGGGLADLMDAERRGTTAALIEAGLPVVDLRVSQVDAVALGGLFVLFETAIALVGLGWGIDPFDQPGVEAAKRYAAALLGDPGMEADRNRAMALLASPGVLE